MRLADERNLTGIELRYPDGQAWSGKGDFDYVREARIIGQTANSVSNDCNWEGITGTRPTPPM